MRNGHREKDVIWNYSIEKVNRYSTDLIELELEERRSKMKDLETTLRTIPIAELGKDNAKRYKEWIAHMDSLDIKKTQKKEEEKKKDPFKALRGVVPFVG